MYQDELCICGEKFLTSGTTKIYSRGNDEKYLFRVSSPYELFFFEE